VQVITGRKIIRNFSSLAISSALDRTLRFVAYSYLARVLGAEAFGMNSFAYTTFIFFSGIANFGMRTLGSREIATHRDEVKRYASNILTMRLVLSVVAFAAMQIFAGVLEQRAEARLLSLIYGASVFFSLQTVDWILMGLEEMQFVGWAIALNGVLNCGLLLTLVSGPEHLLRVAVIESGVNAAVTVALFLIALRAIGGVRIAFEAKLWRYLWQNTVPLGFSLLLFRLFATAPVFIIGALEPDSAVGIFRAGNMIPNFLLYVALAFADTLLPVISRFFIADRERLPKIILSAFRAMAAVGVPIAVGGVFLARPLVALVFGEAYVDGAGVFQLMIFSSIFVYPGIVLRHALPACHRQRLYLKVMILRTGMLVALCVALVPLMGMIGAGVAFLLAEVSGFLLSSHYYHQHIHRIRVLHSTWKALVSGVVMAVVLGLLGDPTTPSSMLGVGSVSVLCYGLVFTFVLKGISTREIQFLRNMLLGRGRVSSY